MLARKDDQTGGGWSAQNSAYLEPHQQHEILEPLGGSTSILCWSTPLYISGTTSLRGRPPADQVLMNTE